MLKLAKTSLLVMSMLSVSIVASDVLVTVNGKNITKQDAELFVNANSPQMHYAQLDKSQQNMIKERLIEKSLFTELAKKEGFKKNPEYLKTLKQIEDELLVNMWMKQQMTNTIISDSEAKEYYEKNHKKFVQKESVHARHILVKTEKEAKLIIEELKGLKEQALKDKFIVLAGSKSTGPTKTNGGDLGSFSKEQMVPEFSNAVWKLQVGEISKEPVKTKFGFHVIYLEGKTKEEVKAYDMVKKNIIASLKQKEFSEKITEVSKELKKKAKIVNYSK